ncbi:hypothetical protein [Dolichospermum compactum]|nr:hypothetical protein [Dolichospermum compactum]
MALAIITDCDTGGVRNVGCNGWIKQQRNPLKAVTKKYLTNTTNYN